MPTLLVPDRSDQERDAVATAWEARGWPVCRLSRFWEPPDLDPSDVRLFGGITFCLFLAEKLGLELVSPPDDFLLKLEPKWLGRPIRVITLREASRQKFPFFAKSMVPKLFRSRVYTGWSELESETRGLEGDTPIMVSPPVAVIAEARCLVFNGRVTSVSLYEGCADLIEVGTFAREFVCCHNVAATYILDVGKISSHGWAVIEANAIWGGGLNGCDANAMVDCLEAACTLSRRT